MKTTYNRVIESLDEKAMRTEGVVTKRQKKIESLEHMIKTYTLALDEHREFVDNRKTKLEAGRKVIEELRGMVDEMNEELQKEVDSYVERTEERESRYTYLRDERMVERWDDLVRKFNRIHQGHGGSLVDNG